MSFNRVQLTATMFVLFAMSALGASRVMYMTTDNRATERERVEAERYLVAAVIERGEDPANPRVRERIQHDVGKMAPGPRYEARDFAPWTLLSVILFAGAIVVMTIRDRRQEATAATPQYIETPLEGRLTNTSDAAQPSGDGEATLARSSVPCFFSISTTKLAVMLVGTLGFYQFYWFYKHWQFIKQREGRRISPFWRAYFPLLFYYDFLLIVKERGREYSTGDLPAGVLWAGWLLTGLLVALPDPFWVAASLSLWFLLPVQEAANAVNRRVAPGQIPKSGFSDWEIVAVIVGIVAFVVGLVGAATYRG